MGAGAGNPVRVLGLLFGDESSALLWARGTGVLFQRPAVTHFAGYFPWVTSLPGVLPGWGGGREGEQCQVRN